jgi:hypothetical protein
MQQFFGQVIKMGVTQNTEQLCLEIISSDRIPCENIRLFISVCRQDILLFSVFLISVP